jgi:predicted  nucleic acid-binding Zn-ribbon protein
VKDLLEAIEYLGIPATIAIMLVGLFVILQIIGEVVEVFGKVVPEFFKVRKYFSRRKTEKEETKQMIKECKELLSDFNSHYDDDNITKRNKWMDKVNSSVKNNDQFIQKLDSKIDKLLEDNENLKTQLNQVKSNVLENEADRLRSELFDCGNRCRRNIRLHPEEMEHIRAVFNKYSKVLHQNGSGEAEFKFITDYYNHQTFPAYHQRND